MGTRNLTLVQKDEKIRIAQYGQWDGYPSGQGVTVHAFIKNANLTEFAKQVDRVVFSTEAMRGAKALQTKLDKLFKTMSDEQTARKCYSAHEIIDKVFDRDEKFIYECWTRDTCANILNVILNAPEKPKKIFLKDETGFAGDSLFCEWAYLINLDTNELEVYRGFNQKKLPKGGRFSYLSKDPDNRDNGYKQIRLLKTFKFNRMPTEKNYVDTLDRLDKKADKEWK
jgi:hypothetical protein